MPQYVDLFRRLDRLDRREGNVALPDQTLVIRACFADIDDPGGPSVEERLAVLDADGSELAKLMLSGDHQAPVPAPLEDS
jgi:hypothetical protein